jgi:hypothetical protein
MLRCCWADSMALLLLCCCCCGGAIKVNLDWGSSGAALGAGGDVPPAPVAPAVLSLLRAVPCCPLQAVPLASVLTPNQFEAELLTGRTIHGVQGALQAAQQLLAAGPHTVVGGPDPPVMVQENWSSGQRWHATTPYCSSCRQLVLWRRPFFLSQCCVRLCQCCVGGNMATEAPAAHTSPCVCVSLQHVCMAMRCLQVITSMDSTAGSTGEVAGSTAGEAGAAEADSIALVACTRLPQQQGAPSSFMVTVPRIDAYFTGTGGDHIMSF